MNACQANKISVTQNRYQAINIESESYTNWQHISILEEAEIDWCKVVVLIEWWRKTQVNQDADKN